jgi:hypothetical protein
VREVLQHSLAFTHRSGILQCWKELNYQRYALGFWAEALYDVCTLFPDAHYRSWLAEAMRDLEGLKMGQPPSLLGANAEDVLVAEQLPRPCPADAGLRVANLGRRGAPELLVLNTTQEPLQLDRTSPLPEGLRWQQAGGSDVVGAAVVLPRGWLRTALAH